MVDRQGLPVQMFRPIQVLQQRLRDTKGYLKRGMFVFRTVDVTRADTKS